MTQRLPWFDKSVALAVAVAAVVGYFVTVYLDKR